MRTWFMRIRRAARSAIPVTVLRAASGCPEHMEIPVVPEAAGALAGIFGTEPGAVGSWLPADRRMITSSAGDGSEAGEEAGCGTSPGNRIVGH
jgi:hypothetical protein